MTNPVPHAMYQAVSDKLTLEIRENLQLRAEIIALNADILELKAELAEIKAWRAEQQMKPPVASMFARTSECESGCWDRVAAE